MKKSVKFLAVLLIFLMPLSAFAQCWWSPNRVRENYRIGESQAEGGLGPINAKKKCPDDAYCTPYGIEDDTVLSSMEGEDKESERVNGGLSIHYIMDMNFLWGSTFFRPNILLQLHKLLIELLILQLQLLQQQVLFMLMGITLLQVEQEQHLGLKNLLHL